MTEQQAILSWLKDAHALEVGALPTLQHHADAAQDYTEVREKLLQHADKTRRHAELIEGCITRLGGHPSALKEAVGSAMGKVTGLANLPTKDPVIKNALGDYAAENFEIASYKSLIAGAEKIGDTETANVCRQILEDEEEMAGWLGGHIPTMTQQFLDKQTGEDESSAGGDQGVGQTVADLGEKGKDAASNVGPRNALLAGGALLAGAGAAMLIGQALRGDKKTDDRNEQNELSGTDYVADYGTSMGQTDDAAIDSLAASSPGMGSDGFIDAGDALTDPYAADLGVTDLGITDLDAAGTVGMTDLGDAEMLSDPLLDDMGVTDELVYTEVWLMPGPYSGVGPRGYDSAGDPTGQEISSRLTQHGQIDASDIEITLDNGEVLLEGTVADDETKRLVEEALESISGVTSVQNMLQVQASQSSIGQSGTGQDSASQDIGQGSQTQPGGNEMSQTSEFEHSTTIDASPDEVYTFMSKVENLPKYLPTTHSAEPQQGDHVRVQGEAQGHEYDADGFFRADESNHRIEWGADEQYYSGWLEVTGQGDNSTMTVHLSFSGGPPAGEGDAPSDESNNAPNRDEIQEGLVKSLESIKNFVEEGRSGGKEEPSAAT